MISTTLPTSFVAANIIAPLWRLSLGGGVRRRPAQNLVGNSDRDLGDETGTGCLASPPTPGRPGVPARKRGASACPKIIRRSAGWLATLSPAAPGGKPRAQAAGLARLGGRRGASPRRSPEIGLVPAQGFEPWTLGLKGRCSARLSYTGLRRF